MLGPRDWGPGSRGLLLAHALFAFVLPLLGPLAAHLMVPSFTHPLAFVGAGFAAQGAIGFFLAAIMLMMFGTQIERQVGTRSLVELYLGATVLGHLVSHLGWVALLTRAGSSVPILEISSYPMGSAYAISALLVAFGYFHRHAQVLFMFLLPLNAWTLVLLGLFGNLFGMLRGDPISWGFFAVLVGTSWKLGIRPWFYKETLLDRWRWLTGKVRASHRRPDRGSSKRRDASHLTLVRGGLSDDPEKPVIH